MRKPTRRTIGRVAARAIWEACSSRELTVLDSSGETMAAGLAPSGAKQTVAGPEGRRRPGRQGPGAQGQ